MNKIQRTVFGTLVFIFLSAFTSGSNTSKTGSKTESMKGAGQKDIKVRVLEPENPDQQKGICILLPPGSGDQQMVRDAEHSLGRNFAKRNWRVLIPQSPNRKSFFGPNADHISSLIQGLGTEKVILAGISNGGISAIEVANQSPQQIQALIIVPGILRNSRDNTRRLNGMPVFLRIGERDELNWAKLFDSSVKQLRSSGAKVDAALLPKTGHVFRVNWKELDPWLDSLPSGGRPQTAVTAPGVDSPLPGYRIWTDQEGRQMQARALLVLGEQVVLLKPNQKQYRFPIKQLSAEDQAFVRENVKVHTAQPQAAPTSKPQTFKGFGNSRSDYPSPPKINRR